MKHLISVQLTVATVIAVAVYLLYSYLGTLLSALI